MRRFDVDLGGLGGDGSDVRLKRAGRVANGVGDGRGKGETNTYIYTSTYIQNRG